MSDKSTAISTKNELNKRHGKKGTGDPMAKLSDIVEKKPRKARETKPRENYDVFTFDLSPTQREFVIAHNKVVIRYFIYEKQHEVILDFSNKEGMVRSVQKQIKSRNTTYTHLYRFTVVAPIDTANGMANSETQEQLVTTILRDVFVRAEAQKAVETFPTTTENTQELVTT